MTLEGLPDVLLAAFASAAGLMLAVWLVSLALRDASIVDIFWGPGFVLIAWVAFVVGPGYEARKLLVAVLTSLWGLRLGLHLLWRNWGEARTSATSPCARAGVRASP